jgi:hypothetical protein
MNRSSVAAISVGTLTTLFLGVAASLLCPLAGLVAGAYFSATAVAAAGMGTVAIWALGAAGALGGLALGKISKPAAVWGAVGIGFVAGALTKAVVSIAGFLSRAFRKRNPSSSAPPEKRPGIFDRLKSIFKSTKLKPSFDASVDKGAQNDAPKPAPALKKEPPKPSL